MYGPLVENGYVDIKSRGELGLHSFVCIVIVGAALSIEQ